MKQMVKIELERAFRSMSFKLSIIIGIIIVGIQFCREVIPAAINPIYWIKSNTLQVPANAFANSIIMGDGAYYTLFVRLIPILATIPYAITYYTDNKKGIVKNYYSRTKKINYLIAKFIAVFTTGGTAAVFPLALNVLASAAVLPSFMIINGETTCSGNGMWSYILYSHPYIYFIMYFILQFICAGLLATVSLVISMYVNNVFIVLLFPSVLCEFLNAVARWFPTRILRFTAPWRLFRIDQIAVNLWQSYLVFILVILFFDIVVYIRRGVKDDVL